MWPSNTTRKKKDALSQASSRRKKEEYHRRHCPESIVCRVCQDGTRPKPPVWIQYLLCGAAFTIADLPIEKWGRCHMLPVAVIFYFRLNSLWNFYLERKSKKGHEPITTYIESENLYVRLFFSFCYDVNYSVYDDRLPRGSWTN